MYKVTVEYTRTSTIRGYYLIDDPTVDPEEAAIALWEDGKDPIITDENAFDEENLEVRSVKWVADSPNQLELPVDYATKDMPL